MPARPMPRQICAPIRQDYPPLRAERSPTAVAPAARCEPAPGYPSWCGPSPATRWPRSRGGGMLGHRIHHPGSRHDTHVPLRLPLRHRPRHAGFAATPHHDPAVRHRHPRCQPGSRDCGASGPGPAPHCLSECPLRQCDGARPRLCGSAGHRRYGPARWHRGGARGADGRLPVQRQSERDRSGAAPSGRGRAQGHVRLTVRGRARFRRRCRRGPAAPPAEPAHRGLPRRLCRGRRSRSRDRGDQRLRGGYRAGGARRSRAGPLARPPCRPASAAARARRGRAVRFPCRTRPARARAPAPGEAGMGLAPGDGAAPAGRALSARKPGLPDPRRAPCPRGAGAAWPTTAAAGYWALGPGAGGARPAVAADRRGDPARFSRPRAVPPAASAATGARSRC